MRQLARLRLRWACRLVETGPDSVSGMLATHRNGVVESFVFLGLCCLLQYDLLGDLPVLLHYCTTLSFVLCFDSPVHPSATCKASRGCSGRACVMSLLSFMPDDDAVPRRFSSTKVLVFRLGPCGSGKNGTCHFSQIFPLHTVRLLVG